MNTLKKIMLAGAANLAMMPSFAACVYPKDVSVPDGAQATEAQMVAAKKSVKAYIAAMEDYLKCLDAETADGSGGARPDQQGIRAQARENMRAVADRYNDEVLAYKAAND